MRARPWRFLALVYLVVGVAAALVHRSTVEAQADAAVAISTVLETPGLTWTVERLTGEPQVDEIWIAGNPTTRVRPNGEGPWPAVVFLNGATRLGRNHPRVQALARGLGRAGYLVLVPDLYGLREGEISTLTLDDAIDVAKAAVARADVRDGRIALVGVSVGASLALLVAAHEPLDRQVSIVAAIAPYADLRNVLRLATTDHYRDDGRLVPYGTDPFLEVVAVQSLAAMAEQSDPLWTNVHALDNLLRNRDPRRFDVLYAALPPELRAAHDRLSPVATAHRVRAPVEIASAPADKYFPLAESRAVAERAPNVRITVTTTLDHAIPEPGDIPDLLRFDAFVVRVLERAARG